MTKSWRTTSAGARRGAGAVLVALALSGATGCADIFYPYNLVGNWDGECSADWEWEDWDTDVVYDVDVEIDLDLSIHVDDDGRLVGDGEARFQMDSALFETDDEVDVNVAGFRSKGWAEINVEGDDQDWEEVLVKLEGDIYQDVVEGECVVINMVDERLEGDFKLRR